MKTRLGKTNGVEKDADSKALDATWSWTDNYTATVGDVEIHTFNVQFTPDDKINCDEQINSTTKLNEFGEHDFTAIFPQKSTNYQTARIKFKVNVSVDT